MTPEQQAAMRQALEGVASMARCGQLDAFIGEPWLNDVFAALEQKPCKYPNCSYPCPDLPDCKDAEEDLYELAKKADNGGQP